MMRQGDMLLVRINAAPMGLKKKDCVLARGEATGHSHRMVGGTTFADTAGQQYVVLEKEGMLLHEEHDQITVPKGAYKVLLQREYSVVEGIRQVLD